MGTYAFAEAVKNTTRSWETQREHHQGSGLEEEEIARERFLFHLDGALAAAKGALAGLNAAPPQRRVGVNLARSPDGDAERGQGAVHEARGS